MANLFGTGINQVSTNGMLGNLAFQDKAYLSVDKVGIGTTFVDSGTSNQILQVYGGGAYVSGSVGIGTTNPTSNLHVIGDARFTGVVTASSFVGNLTGIATTATNLSDAANITTGTINSSRLSGSYNINVSYATSSGIATYATSSGIATYATSSGIATYATSSGIATYATSSGIATYATSSGIATYASTAGIATYATSSGIATYASTAGVSTSVIGGIGSITQLSVSGISTFTNGPVLIGAATSTGTALQRLQVTDGAYISGNLGIGTTNPTSKLQVQGTVSISSTTTSAEFIGGGADLRNLSGTHLVSYASASDISNSSLSISGISTYNQVGILTGSFATETGDSFGVYVTTSADGKTIVVGAYLDEVGATTGTGVVYVFDRVGNSFNQVGILTSILLTNGELFGISIATSADGKTIFVGAPYDEVGATSDTGVVYIFDRVGNSFNQVGILTGSLDTNTPDFFGYSVDTSSDGKTIVVGAIYDEVGATTASGVVYVFDRVGNSFNQVGILTGTYATDIDDNFGGSVAISADGKTIVIGNPSDEIGATTGTGVVYVFDRVGNSFNQVGILTGSFAIDSNDGFGKSVATSADGKTIVVGAYNDEVGATSDTGVAYVFDRVGNSFNQVGILTGSFSTNSLDYFGTSVATSADGKTIVVGAYNDEIGATNDTGVVYIFKRIGNSFNQVGILTGSFSTNSLDYFGISVDVSADGKTIVVGAYQDEIGATADTGVVYVFDEIRDTYLYSSSSGNIGIGTTNPTSKLQVIGDVDSSSYKISNTTIIDSSRNLSNITSFDSTVTSIWDTVGITTVNKTLVNRENLTVTGAGTTITLPASPSAGWEVAINVGNFTNTTVERNGSNIMGLAENIVIDYSYASLTFIYTGNATQGWRIY